MGVEGVVVLEPGGELLEDGDGVWPGGPAGVVALEGLVQIDTALGDAGYDAEHNHRLCREELGVEQTVIRLNRRNTGRRWPKTPYRRTMRRRFPKATYNQRWHAESGFSQHKRRLGSALTARGDASQARELALRVLTHNLMLLAEVA